MSAAQQAVAMDAHQVRSFAYVDAGFASGVGVSQITIPATARAGDLAILFDISVSGSTPTDVVPTGWIGIGTSSSDGLGRNRASYKVLAAGDPGAVITSMANTSGSEKILAVFRPDGVIRSVTFGSWAGQNTAGDPTSQTVAASGQAVPLVVLGFGTCTSGPAAFSTATPAFDATILGAGSLSILGYKMYIGSPANHDVDKADQGYNSLQSFWIAAQ